MTTLRITVDDAQADTLRQMLQHIDLIKTIEQEPVGQQTSADDLTSYEQLKKIQEAIGDRKLFTEIEDPSVWQREIRKEWDRDF